MQIINPNEEKTMKAIEQHAQLVYGIALTQLKQKHYADDVYQDVFLTYFDKEIEFNDDEHEKAWLIRTTINICKRYNYSPWQVRRESFDESSCFELQDQEETRVFYAVRELKASYRVPIYLRYFENMPIEEIAASLEIKPATVRKRLSRARAHLKEKLECDYFE